MAKINIGVIVGLATVSLIVEVWLGLTPTVTMLVGYSCGGMVAYYECRVWMDKQLDEFRREFHLQ